MPRPCRRWARIRLKEAVFPVGPMPSFRSVCRDGQGRRSRPAGALTVPRETDPREHRIDRKATVEIREERSCAVEAASGLRGEGAIRLVRSLGRRSFLLALSITKLDPDAGHPRRL